MFKRESLLRRILEVVQELLLRDQRLSENVILRERSDRRIYLPQRKIQILRFAQNDNLLFSDNLGEAISEIVSGFALAMTKGHFDSLLKGIGIHIG